MTKKNGGLLLTSFHGGGIWITDSDFTDFSLHFLCPIFISCITGIMQLPSSVIKKSESETLYV